MVPGRRTGAVRVDGYELTNVATGQIWKWAAAVERPFVFPAPPARLG
jgi:hypothetical protein